jgi:predicted enzyme related to lactoylglutathione lyase
MSVEFESAATVFTVQDVARSAEHYRDVVGFHHAFPYGGEPAAYAAVERGGVIIHLPAAARAKKEPGHGVIYCFVDGVDELHGQIKTRGGRVLNEPQNYPYEMRDFDVLDPDGNRLIFGQSTAKA